MNNKLAVYDDYSHIRLVLDERHEYQISWLAQPE